MKKEKQNNKIYITFIVLSLFLGGIFSILIPMFQVPDEEVHINELYKFLGEETIFSEESESFNDMLGIVRNYDNKVDINEYIDLDDKLDVINGVKSISIYTIRYLPQTIGMIVSEIFKLPVVVALTISELLAVIFYTLIGVKTLKLMPIKKEVMMMIMLLPIGIQQIGSFSYDMMLLSLSFLFIAYILHLKFNKEEINNIDLLKILGLLLTIILIKIPYVLLGLLIFILPFNKIVLYNKIKSIFNTKTKKAILIIGFIIIILIAAKFLINNNYIKVLLAFITNPIDGLSLIYRTLKAHLGFYFISIMGYFGWLDTPVSILFGIFIILNLLIVNIPYNNKEKKLSRRDNIYLFILGLFSSLIIVISLFDWTIKYNNIDTSHFTIADYSYHISNMYDILGVQGRYFIPFIPLLILPIEISIEKLKNRKLIKVIQIVHYAVLTIYMLIIILNRYWI